LDSPSIFRKSASRFRVSRRWCRLKAEGPTSTAHGATQRGIANVVSVYAIPPASSPGKVS